MRVLERVCLIGGRKACLLLLAGFASGIGQSAQCGATYFVDAQTGNDAWSGQQAKVTGSDGPWRTLVRAAQTDLKPGDTLFLHCGSVWHEALRIQGSGSEERPVVVKPFGACAPESRPEIRPTQPVSEWRKEPDGLYSTPAAKQITRVVVDGVALRPARYPAKGLLYADGGLLVGRRTAGLIDGSLQENGMGEKDISGTRVLVRTVGWKIENVGVESVVGKALRFSKPTEYPVRKGAGYYLEGARWMLEDLPGWFWDRGAQRLFIRLPDGKTPNGLTVELAGDEPGLHLTKQSHVSVGGLRVRQAGGDGIRIDGGAGIILRDVEVLQSGRDGIAATGGAVIGVERCRIRQSGRDGIALLNADGSRVTDSLIEESGTTAGPRNAFAAINAARSSYVRIERNRIQGAAYVGIKFWKRTQVVNNVIRDTCLILDDCGAIYTWTNHERRASLSSVVRGNIIENVLGGRDGNPDPFTLAAGIYLDDFTNGVMVEGNTVRNAERGIYLHNAFDNTVQKNTVFGARAYGLVLAADHAVYPVAGSRSNTIRSNVVVSTEGAPFVYYLDRAGRDFIDVMDDNAYLGNKSGKGFVIHRKGQMGDSVDRRSEADFRKLSGKSSHGRFRNVSRPPVLLMNDRTVAREYACPLDSSIACGRAINPSGESISWPVRVPPYGAVVVLDR